MVDACSFELVGLTVDAQSMLRVDFDFTHSERSDVAVDDYRGAGDFDLGTVEAGRIGGPEVGLREFGGQQSLATLFGCEMLLCTDGACDVAMFVKKFAGDRCRYRL